MTTDNTSGVVAAVYVAGPAEQFLPTLRSLADHAPVPVVVGGPGADEPVGPDWGPELVAWSLPGVSPAELVNRVWDRYHADVLFVTDAVLVPPEFLRGAVEIAGGDIRAGTVSFLSNAAAHLSFPEPERPGLTLVPGHDEVSITRLLRSRSPVVDPVPIPLAAGACSLFTAAALSAVGPVVDGPGALASEVVEDVSLRAARRGFIPFLDPSTFYTRPTDLSVEPTHRLESASALSRWAAERHPYAQALLDEAASPESPLGLAMACARAKVLGLRVVIDGACLGPDEMGTQVATVALVKALAARDDVAEVQVAVPAGVQASAAAIAQEPKVRIVAPGDLRPADVAHRPYQPDPSFRIDQWRGSAGRVVVTMLDLIAYQIGSYHEGSGDWFKYRRLVEDVAAGADCVLTISEDVRRHIELERLPVDPSRLVVAPIGTDHLTGDEPARMPRELISRGFAAEEFVLTLGANFSHKNRDLALRAHRRLRERRPGLALVFAGVHVPYGSSRVSEAKVPPVDGVFDLPGTTPAERNWLLRHATVVLYPTSAEGFGLVPFEAARFGTPTVHVGFGALREFGGEPPVAPTTWDPGALAEAVEALMADPELARAQVAATLAAADKHAWSQTAEDLVRVYRTVLSLPPAVPGRRSAGGEPGSLQRQVEELQREKALLAGELREIRSTRAFRTASLVWALRRRFRR